MSPSALGELSAAVLQAAITLGLAALCWFLYARYRKRYFFWWAVAWGLYVLRIGAIVGFLATLWEPWLFVHQTLTGWTALALLWAALVFSLEARWRWWGALLVLFPPVWAHIAIYELENFLLAAGPTVVFLSFATMWTGWVFLRHWRRSGSKGGAFLGSVLVLWALHHLDYPLLRAKGALSPWGYYLDIVFELATGLGILLLVLEDLQRGLHTLSTLSGDLQTARAGQGAAANGDVRDALLARPLGLAGVSGAALYLEIDGRLRVVRGAGACAAWSGCDECGDREPTLARAVAEGRPVIASGWRDPLAGTREYAYAAVLPIFRGARAVGALVIVGDERDPFTALGEEFLLTLGRQVGAALENAGLYARLEARTRELERLSARMVQQHEEERRRISLELHDETAQVFSAVKLQLGLLREDAPPSLGARFDRALALVDTGIGSIRDVTRRLRPPLLDDLGLVPALRALAMEFAERTGIAATFDADASLPPVPEGAELALFRALQEALSNVARHATARSVAVTLRGEGEELVLAVRDDGRGIPGDADAAGRMGLAGMRERLGALGGSLHLRAEDGGGTLLTARIPLAVEAVS